MYTSSGTDVVTMESGSTMHGPFQLTEIVKDGYIYGAIWPLIGTLTLPGPKN